MYQIVFKISLSDPNGMVPKILINSFAPRAPVDWLKKMITFCMDVQKNPEQMKDRDAYVNEHIGRLKTCPMKP